MHVSPSTNGPLKTASRTSLQRRMTASMLLLLGFSVTLLGFLSFLTARSLIISRTLSELSSIATLREDAIEREVALDREEAAIVLTSAAHASEVLIPELLKNQLQLRRSSVEGVTLFDENNMYLSSAGFQSPLPLRTLFQTTIVPSLDRKNGWVAHDVYVPLVSADGQRTGTAAVHFDAQYLLKDALSAALLGDGGRVTLAREQGGEFVVVQRSEDGEPLRMVPIGTVDDPAVRSLPIAKAAIGVEGAELARSEDGRNVLAAYRTLPAFGWGMVVEMDAAAALAGVAALGTSLALISALLLGLSLVLAIAMARQITLPLRKLSSAVSALAPGHWEFRKTAQSGDEIETLDRVIDDLAWRLRMAYENLEGKMRVTAEGLRRESALDTAILESIAYGVLVIDADGVISDVNPAGAQLFVSERRELIGQPARSILQFVVKAGHIPDADHPVTKALAGGSVRSRPADHLRLLRRNQTFLPVSLVAAPLLSGDKQFGAVVVLQDMTEERQIDYMKSEFISLASHQLRTPLSSIRWYTEMLTSGAMEGFSEDARTYVSEISTASERMANLIEALLHVAKIENGVLIPEKKDVVLNGFVQEICEEWKNLGKEKSVAFSARLPSHSVSINTDPILLQIVLQNLLSNALKYSPAGSAVSLDLRIDDDHATIEITDSGVGISEDDQMRVFQKFFRGRNVRQIDTDGNGLGLYISRSVATALGGDITFESTQDKGSTFLVRLPL